MIAQPYRHYESNTLRELLDEFLPRDQAEQVEAHLSQCAQCRSELEQIAGQRHWWDETVDVLAESTVNPASPETRPPQVKPPTETTALDESLDWILPLLDKSTSDGIGRIDQYPVQGVIGQGGMGVVLRAIDTDLNRPVAIKVLSPHLAGVGAARARFMREAQAAATVVHPSIVPIYSVVTSARLPYIVMPCINGGNLQQRIDREGPLDIAEVLRIGLQIAEALVAAHCHGVIHRDIKPANILIEEGNGRALISDFGLARALDDATLTVSGMIAGTPQYMSPEQARGEPIDARSDLFSLGSLLYALATGRPPFRADSPLAVLRKISESTPRPIHQINEQMPAWFDALVSQLMQLETSKRVASADDAAKLLRDALAHVRNPSLHALPNLRPAKRVGWLAASAIILATSILAFAGYSIFLAPAAATPDAKSEAATTASGGDPQGKSDQPQMPGPLSSLPRQTADAWYGAEITEELRSIQIKLQELAIKLEPASPSSPVIDHLQPLPALDLGEP